MATKTADRASVDLRQTSRPYKGDLFGWVEDQVKLLRAGRISDIDATNIAEELNDVGLDQYDKLESSIRIILLHLLKWDQQPTHRSKSWVFSIKTQRRQIGRVLRKNPSLKPWIEEAIRESYQDARDEAQEQTGLPAKVFALGCPYDWDTILSRGVEFEGVSSPEADLNR